MSKQPKPNRKQRGQRTLDSGPAETDLVPILNVVMCLIPAILAGTSVQAGVINVVPEPFGAHTTAAETEEALNLTVAVGAEGIRITARDDALDEGPIEIPNTAQGTDLPSLYTHLARIKDAHPTQTRLNLVADATVPLNRLVPVMDVARHRLTVTEPLDAAQLMTAAVARSPDGAATLLWPDVVFAHAR